MHLNNGDNQNQSFQRRLSALIVASAQPYPGGVNHFVQESQLSVTDFEVCSPVFPL
jgi:hypothetical protein